MWCLRPLSVLLLLSTVPTGSEVVRSMSDCSDFLLQKSPPNIPGILEDGNILDQNRYKPICQTYEGVRRFVTLYDTKNKIPVFSAYKYRGVEKDVRRPHTPTMMEPQLEGNTKNMWDNIYKNQATNKDYDIIGNKYDRGHLFPSDHAFDKKDKISTFTLTNMVPQAGTFNKGSWNRMENCVKCVMENHCLKKKGVPEGFVVIGAQPSHNKPQNKLNNNVNIPKMLWSAFCCYNYRSKKWLASAHWGKNIAEPASETRYMQTKTLKQLSDELGIGVFLQKYCPWNETVAGLYQRLNEANSNCKCPPS